MRKSLTYGLVAVVAAVITAASYGVALAMACEEHRIAGCQSSRSGYTVVLVAGIAAEIVLLGRRAAVLALYAPFAGAGIGSLLAGTVGVPGNDPELILFGVGMVAGFPVLLLLIAALVTLGGIFERRRVERLQSTGVAGTATVVSVLDHGTLNGLAQVRMRLRLETPGPLGHRIEVETTEAFARLAMPRAGDRFAVMIDPDQPTSWVYAPGPALDERTRLRNLVEIAKHAGRRVPPPPVGTANDQVAELRRLRDLHAEGRLSAAELAARSAEVLGPGEPGDGLEAHRP